MLSGPAGLEPGRLLEIGPAEMSTGGAVPNIGLALHRLGVPVRLMGKVGDDLFGSAVLEALRARDPQLAADMVVGAGEITSYSIVISPPGVDRSFLHCSGANDTFTADDVRYDELASAPSVPLRLSADHAGDVRARGERAAADARAGARRRSGDLAGHVPPGSGRRRRAGRLAAAAEGHAAAGGHVLPSIEELLFMLDRDAYGRLEGGADVVDLDLLRRLGEQLLGMGAAVAAIKLGERGLYVRTSDTVRDVCGRLSLDAEEWRDREIVSPCFRARRVAGTTGAGDCTIAGFLAALLRGDGPVQAATSATAVGASSVEAPDATSGVPPWPEIAARVEAGWERHPVQIRLEARGSSPTRSAPSPSPDPTRNRHDIARSASRRVAADAYTPL